MVDANTVCVIDDDPDVLDSISALLETSGFTVSAFRSAAAFLSRKPFEAGCLIVDLKMPEMTGIELQRRLAQDAAHLPVIVISGFGELRTAVEAMKLGAIDFIEKPFDDEMLLGAVKQALTQDRNKRQWLDAQNRAAQRLASLSPREQEVLAEVAQGSPSKIIAYNLGISRRTVEIHRTNIMRKVGVRNLAELVSLTHQAGQAPALDM
ncbi:response regulator transcription factor [Consotaella aegiceratis]|uniref:response regulator transcription factor n=1 Tax=Consotaella aegiceratis TaxID=3097961 RepID=UPI002F3EB762